MRVGVGRVERANQEAREERIRGAREGGGGRGSEATPLQTGAGRCRTWHHRFARARAGWNREGVGRREYP